MKNDQDPIKRKDPKQTIPKAQHYLHVVYFAFVAVHGPYSYVAGVLCILGIIILTLHLED